MEIELKNGQKLMLEVTPLLLEYLEDYEGGIQKLKEDAKGQLDENGYTRTMYVTNHLLYSAIASNSDEPLTYRQAVRLVRLEDVQKIIEFMIENVPELKENKTLSNIKHRM